MILPLSPEPETFAKSIPLSSAIFLAKGEAKILSPSDTVFETSFFSEEFSDFFSTFLFSDVDDFLLPPDSLLNTASTSVPSGPITAKTVSTGEDSPS